jgi:hypothetical protein
MSKAKSTGPKGLSAADVRAQYRYEKDIAYCDRRVRDAEHSVKTGNERIVRFTKRRDTLVSQGPPIKAV